MRLDRKEHKAKETNWPRRTGGVYFGAGGYLRTYTWKQASPRTGGGEWKKSTLQIRKIEGNQTREWPGVKRKGAQERRAH